jgi:hypothetical protein
MAVLLANQRNTTDSAFSPLVTYHFMRLPCADMQGHSKNPPGDGFDGFGAVFAEVFACFADGLASAADDGKCRVAYAGYRACTGAAPAAVLVKRDIPDMMQSVFDAPVGAIEREKARGRGVGNGQACDQIDHFDADFAVDLAGAGQACDLGEAGPVEMRYGFGADRDPACFKAAMLFAERLRRLKIRRRTVVHTARV